MRPSLLALIVAAVLAGVVFGAVRANGSATTAPSLVQDVRTGVDPLNGPTNGGSDPIQDYIQPDTEIEPSIAVNPTNPKNVVLQ